MGRWRPGCIIVLSTYNLAIRKAWESAHSFAAAYEIGRVESQAALALLTTVPRETVTRLTELVRTIPLANIKCNSCLGREKEPSHECVHASQDTRHE